MFNFILDKLRKLFYFENAENYIPTEPDTIDSELREFTRMYMKFHREILSEYPKLTEADQARLAIDDKNGTISSKITKKISEEFWNDDRTIDKLIGWVINNGTARITSINWFMKDHTELKNLLLSSYINRPSDDTYKVLQEKFRARGFDFQIYDKHKIMIWYSLSPV